MSDDRGAAIALDLIIRNGTIVTAADTFRGDIGVAEGRVARIGRDLGAAQREIDATDLLVLPGGVDAHCHIDEPPFMGVSLADDFASATRAAACGGTTTIIPFANQLPGRSLREAVEDYRGRAHGKALIDYAFHVLLRDLPEALALREMPGLMDDGYRSYKVFMSYPGFMLPDEAILDVMTAARRQQGTVLVHAENGHCIHWLSERLQRAGRTALNAFPESAPEAVEREATHRAITLAELSGSRVLIVHVSSAQALEQIEWAQGRRLRVLAETCPQYLIDSADKLKGEGWEPAKYLCSPPPRGGDNAQRLWSGVSRGIFQVLSSDHCPYRFEGTAGKRGTDAEPHFRHVPPGVPGIEARLPLLYDAGVLHGRISAQQFVAMTSANPARQYGLYPRKGSLAPGSDADIAVWDPRTATEVRHESLHDACDYTPYEGRRVGAWPIITVSRGEVVWDRGWVSADHGRGQFLAQNAHP